MYKLFRKDPRLASALPETRPWSKHNLSQMIHRYRSVIMKPSAGSTGAGIIKLSQKEKERFEIRLVAKRFSVTGIDAAYTFIRRRIRASYLIQQHIPLAEVDGRPMDIRVIVQRHDQDDPWTVTGYVAKIAGPGYIVTNVTRSGGYVLPVREAIVQSTAKNAPIEHVMKTLFHYSIVGAKIFSAHDPRRTVFGFDLGIDHHGKVWIIEINGKPSLSHFVKLKDRDMYRRIRSYGYNPKFPPLKPTW